MQYPFACVPYLTSKRVKKAKPVATLQELPLTCPWLAPAKFSGSTPMGLAGMGELAPADYQLQAARGQGKPQRSGRTFSDLLAPIPGAFFVALACSLLPKSVAGPPAVAWRPAMTCQIVHCAAQRSVPGSNSRSARL